MTDGRLSLITAATVEPVDLPTAKNHLRVSHATDDERITRLISVARNEIETETHRALLTQTWDWKLTCWDYSPGGFEVPLPPLQSVTSITYLDANGDSQTWATTEYDVSTPAGPQAERGRIALAYLKYFPILRAMRNDAVTVRFVAGYGAAATAVPVELVQAVLLRLEWHYDGNEKALEASRALIAPFASVRF